MGCFGFLEQKKKIVPQMDNKMIIKEYHFHVYWNLEDFDLALNLHDLIEKENREGAMVAKILRINKGPIGPHPLPSYEVWVPIEYFSIAYSFFLLNRPPKLSVLIHPLTREEIRDHTERATFLGKSYPLDLTQLNELLPHIPAQYPELGLGYSAKH